MYVQKFPIPTRRRRLVVEVAPNVIDVSVVALPGSPFIVTNVESDGEGVPASHPWDSDEEDELDTHSRGGVPILGHALVESRWIEDPLFSVPPTVRASSDATVGGRPRQSERVPTQTDNDIDADMHLFLRTWSMLWSQIWQWKVTGPQKRTHQWFRPSLQVPGADALSWWVVPQSVGTPQSVRDVFESDDADGESRAVVNHFDMTVADSDLSVEVTPRHQLRVRSTQPTRLDNPLANRFAALRDDDDPFAEDSSNESMSNRFDDLDDGRRPEEAGVSTVSDTSSVIGELRVRRRLSLVWDEIHRPQSSMDVEEDPESIHLEDEGSDGFASERGMSEPDEEEQELDDPPPIGAPLEFFTLEPAMPRSAWQVWTNSICQRYSSTGRG